MQLTQSPKFNRNYAAKIVEIKDFIKHPNPKCERLKCCTIDGYSIAVSIDTNPGTYVYFPIECAIDDRANNLFRDKVKNVDKGQAGMSPLSVVYQRDLEYEKLMNKSNEIQG